MDEAIKQLEEIERYAKRLKRFFVSLERTEISIKPHIVKQIACIERDIENAHTAIDIAYSGINPKLLKSLDYKTE